MDGHQGQTGCRRPWVGSSPYGGGRTRRDGLPERISRKSLFWGDDKSTGDADHGLMALERHTYFVFRVSGLLSVLAVTATLFVTGGWDAAAAAFAIAAGMVFVLSFIVLVTVGDGSSAPTRA